MNYGENLLTDGIAGDASSIITDGLVFNGSILTRLAYATLRRVAQTFEAVQGTLRTVVSSAWRRHGHTGVVEVRVDEPEATTWSTESKTATDVKVHDSVKTEWKKHAHGRSEDYTSWMNLSWVNVEFVAKKEV